jgi:hypothetical protein
MIGAALLLDTTRTIIIREIRIAPGALHPGELASKLFQGTSDSTHNISTHTKILDRPRGFEAPFKTTRSFKRLTPGVAVRHFAPIKNVSSSISAVSLLFGGTAKPSTDLTPPSFSLHHLSHPAIFLTPPSFSPPLHLRVISVLGHFGADRGCFRLLVSDLVFSVGRHFRRWSLFPN